MYVCTRCTCLGAAQPSLARKLLDGPRRSWGQARAAKRRTDGRRAHVSSFFSFCQSNAVSRLDAQPPTENRRKIDEKNVRKSTQTDKKSMRNRFWAVWAVRGRLGNALGRVRNGLGTPRWAVLAAKLAVLAAKLAVRAAKLAVSSDMLALWVASGPLSNVLRARTLFRAAFEASICSM